MTSIYRDRRASRAVSNLLDDLTDVLGRFIATDPRARTLRIDPHFSVGLLDRYLRKAHRVHLGDADPTLLEPVSPATFGIKEQSNANPW